MHLRSVFGVDKKILPGVTQQLEGSPGDRAVAQVDNNLSAYERGGAIDYPAVRRGNIYRVEDL